MINFFLTDYVFARDAIEQEVAVAFRRIQADADARVTDEDKARLLENFKLVRDVVEKLVLTATDHRLGRVNDLLRFGTPRYTALLDQLRPLFEALQDDITTEYFYHYPHRHGVMVFQVSANWAGTFKAFPSAAAEITDAIDCFALGRPTACVFHLMRTAELGLRALARRLKVKLLKKQALEWADWQTIINGINSSIKLTANAPRGAKRDAELEFCRGAIASFEGFKDAYRNSVMHTRSRYNELQAEDVINHVRGFMERLSSRIDENGKPVA